MKKSNLVLLAFILFAFLTGTLNADLIVLTHSGSGASGTIGQTSFSDVDFSIVAIGDTNAVINAGNSLRIDHASATIQLGGVGTFQFTIPTSTFVNNDMELVGFSRALSLGGGDLVSGPSDSSFASWDMESSIGPISGNDGRLLQWGRTPRVQTSGGTLNIFTQENLPVTFTAEVVPEPSAMIVLCGICLLGLNRRTSPF